jgi:3-phosphoshikimate 1-carboxyvinyltransferase
VYDAGRLRLKESDRLAAISNVMSTLGVNITETTDGFTIVGGAPLRGGEVSAWSDHRIAMTAAVASLLADGPVTIDGAECAAKSYPGFFEDFRRGRRGE